ncbi:MAG: winged helix-turn-helix transcriptional regulator [Desulfobacteraceae bacterium]|nr:winged helix-turn-helix transcriptional regulator [Desulfobacteraceae bacterium]
MLDTKLDTEAITKIFKALGHPTRVKIVEHLITIDSCVCGEIVNIFPFSQSTISQHLKLLKESGIVHGEIEGPKTCYCVDKDVLQKFKNYVSNL